MSDITWEATDAQGEEFGKEAYCPYYDCRETVTFVGSMGYKDGEIVDVKFECESCGHSHEWAQSDNANEAAKRAPKSETQRRSC